MLNATMPCVLKTFYYHSISNVSMALELLSSIVMIICTAVVNYVYWMKLKKEKRDRPLGRKGNVIEPIMAWHCIFRIWYPFYYALFFWGFSNGIIPLDQIPGCLLYLSHELLTVGSVYDAYNSLFVALIRYIYIVHERKANQWDFEKVSRIFQIISIVFPVSMEIIRAFTDTFEHLYDIDVSFKDCVDSYSITYGAITNEILQPPTARFVLGVIPTYLVRIIYYTYFVITAIVSLNMVEAILYLRIFENIRR